MCTKLVSFIRLYRDARSTEHKIYLEKRSIKFFSVHLQCQIYWPDTEPEPAQRQFYDYPPEAWQGPKIYFDRVKFCSVKAKRPQMCSSYRWRRWLVRSSHAMAYCPRESAKVTRYNYGRSYFWISEPESRMFTSVRSTKSCLKIP
jgi:hypothetical protein